MLTTFSRLKERINQQAGSLARGKQQMLSMGDELMSQPRLLLIDELSLGLMPKAIDNWGLVTALSTTLKFRA